MGILSWRVSGTLFDVNIISLFTDFWIVYQKKHEKKKKKKKKKKIDRRIISE